MGYQAIGRLSLVQLTKHIRRQATDTSKVFITPHAKSSMRKRKINVSLVYECLRNGNVIRQPEPNLGNDNLECRMERYAAGKNCCVIVALCDEDPEMICVTVFYSN